MLGLGAKIGIPEGKSPSHILSEYQARSIQFDLLPDSFFPTLLPLQGNYKYPDSIFLGSCPWLRILHLPLSME